MKYSFTYVSKIFINKTLSILKNKEGIKYFKSMIYLNFLHTIIYMKFLRLHLERELNKMEKSMPGPRWGNREWGMHVDSRPTENQVHTLKDSIWVLLLNHESKLLLRDNSFLMVSLYSTGMESGFHLRDQRYEKAKINCLRMWIKQRIKTKLIY